MAGQSDRSELLVGAVWVEHTAMSPRFIPLSDDGIDSGGGDGLSLIEIRCRRQEHDPGGAERLDPIASRHTEVEADNRGALGQQHRKLGVVDQKGLIDFRQAGRRFRAEAGEFRCEPRQPRSLARGIRDGRPVAEHVDLERPLGPGPNRDDHPAGLVGVDGPDTDGAKPAVVRHRRGHFRRRHARHRGLDDR